MQKLCQNEFNARFGCVRRSLLYTIHAHFLFYLLENQNVIGSFGNSRFFLKRKRNNCIKPNISHNIVCVSAYILVTYVRRYQKVKAAERTK